MTRSGGPRRSKGARSGDPAYVGRYMSRRTGSCLCGATYELRPTHTIARCKTCGTPLPAEEDEKNVYLTAGTLDEPIGAGIKAHIFNASAPTGITTWKVLTTSTSDPRARSPTRALPLRVADAIYGPPDAGVVSGQVGVVKRAVASIGQLARWGAGVMGAWLLLSACGSDGGGGGKRSFRCALGR